MPALQRAAAAGGLTSLLAGLVAVALPPAGLLLGGGAALGLTLRGVGFGAWMWSMVGVGLRHSRIDQYQSAIKSGQLLMMIDVPRDQVEEIEGLATGHHPAAELEGTDPNIPTFP